MDEQEENKDYSIEKEDEKFGGVSYSTWGAVIVLFIVGTLMFLGPDRFGDLTIPKAHLWAVWIICGWLTVRYGDLEILLFSPVFLCNPIKTTWTGRLDPIGNYYAIRMGGRRAPVVGDVEGRAGTIFVPITSVTKVGKSAVSTTTVKPVAAASLPREIRENLKFRNYPKPYFWGTSSAEFDIKFADTKRLQHELEMVQKENTATSQAADNVMKKTEDVVSWAGRLTERRKEGYFEKLKKIVTPEDN